MKPIIDKPLPPPPRESTALSRDSRLLSASPEPISRSPSASSAAHYRRPRAPSPPSTRPTTEATTPKAQFTVTSTQEFDVKALYPRKLFPTPAAGPSTGLRMISVPFVPPEQSKEERPGFWQSLKRTPSKGTSALQKYLMPPALASQAPEPAPVDGPSRPRGGAKGKFIGGWKMGNLIPKWGNDHPDTRPANPAGGRVLTNLDDPEPEPQDNALLPPLLPSSPTVYTDDAYPAPRDTYGATSTAPSDAGTSVSRRPARRSRPPPPPPGQRTPRRPNRAPPPPASQASWVTFGRFGQTPAPSTYQGDGAESTFSGADTEADRQTIRSTYTANRETLNNNRRTFVTGQSVYTTGGISTIGRGLRSMDGLSDLASRPATPDASPTKTRSTRFETELESPIEQPEMPAGPSMMLSTVASEYPPETPVAETPLESEPPLNFSPSHGPNDASTYDGTYRTEDPSAPPSPEDERPRMPMPRAYSGYPATAVHTDYDDDLQSPSEYGPNRDTTFTGPSMVELAPPPLPQRDTTFTAQTEMTERAPSEIATTGGLTRNNTQVTHDRNAVSRSNSGDSGIPERSPTSDTKVSHMSDEKASRRISHISPPQAHRRSRPIRHKRIADPHGRYSRKPFGYFHRYPRRSSALDPKNLTRASMRRLRLAKGRSGASTSSSRTYIPSRIGRLRRLFRDFINLPWRGDSDYYGGKRGITTTHHFRGGGNRGGVSIRPRRDSNIPRAPWYRPKGPSMRMDLPRNPGQTQGWNGLRVGLNSPLTDGSDRGTLDRFGNLPASASPFVSPYHMRSPYHEVPPPMPTKKQRTPSPLVPQGLTGGPIHASPRSLASSKSLKNQHALLDSYGPTLSPPLHPVTAGPPTALPVPDGYFFPPPEGPPLTTYRMTTGVPSTAFPGDYDDEDEDDMEVPRGITIHKPGEQAIWVPFQQQAQHPPMPPPYGAPPSPPEAYRRHAPRPRSRKQGRGLPVTIHATSTIAPSSPPVRVKQPTQSTFASESQYAPSQIGAAV